MPDSAEPTTAAPLMCLECRRAWLDESERWRLYLMREDPPRPLVYCPDCAAREFD